MRQRSAGTYYRQIAHDTEDRLRMYCTGKLRDDLARARISWRYRDYLDVTIAVWYLAIETLFAVMVIVIVLWPGMLVLYACSLGVDIAERADRFVS